MLALPEARPLLSTNMKNKNKFVVHLHCFLPSVSWYAASYPNYKYRNVIELVLPAVTPESREESLLAYPIGNKHLSAKTLEFKCLKAPPPMYNCERKTKVLWLS